MPMRVTFTLNERAEDSQSSLRSTFSFGEHLWDYPSPRLRVTYSLAEHLWDYPGPRMRTTKFLSEYITDLLEWETVDLSELIMSTEPYPDLIGLSFPVSQKPMFSTGVQSHTSGRETRTSYWENPLWEFTLSYDYLPDSPQKDSDYKKIVGFFLARKGSFETFLFYKRGDQNVVDGLIGTGTGSAVSFPFVKEWGSWLEPVGYVDTTSDLHVYVRDQTSLVISGTHTVTVPHAVMELYTVKVGATILTATSSTSPAMGEYHQSGSTFTFNAGRDGQTVVIDYKWEAIPITDYSVGLPNTLSFTSAPLAGATITATFRYAYICRFKEDEADFDQFMDKLYEFDQVTLRSMVS